MTKLMLRGLGRRFAEFVAVDRIDLGINSGEFVSLLGPSGCGKTTTLRMIAGFLDPTAGSIEMDGKILSSPGSSLPPEKRQMSMIFQSYAIWPNMTVEQNVAFGLKLRRMPSAERTRRVAEILDIVKLGHLAGRFPAELSGGQQQRVALARAIVIQPTVLLLDEPLSNLDAALREEMRFEIRRLHDEFRITTIYVTHDQGEAMVTSDRIAVMNHGRIEQCDDPFTLYNHPRTRFVAGFIGRTNFIDGKRNGSDFLFDHFSIPCAQMNGRDEMFGDVCFSVRPHTMKLHRRALASGVIGMEVQVMERTYLGEFWDYLVLPVNGRTRLKVSTPPNASVAVGERAWLEIDPQQMIAVV